MSIVRFVLNTPEYEANILAQTMKASRDADAGTTTERVAVGDVLDSKRVLRTVQKTLLETEIALANLDPGVLGLAIMAGYYPYLENMNHEEYSPIIQRLNAQVWIKFTSNYKIENTLETYINIGNTILHESLHNLGFAHLDPLDRSIDVAYVMGETYASTLYDPAFRKKYANEFKRIVPFFEEKYSNLIVDEPAVANKMVGNAFFDNRPLATRSLNGEPLTAIECIIENPEDYIKPYRYVVKNGKRVVDTFIPKY